MYQITSSGVTVMPLAPLPGFGKGYSVTCIVSGLTVPSLGLFRSVKKGTPRELTAIP